MSMDFIAMSRLFLFYSPVGHVSCSLLLLLLFARASAWRSPHLPSLPKPIATWLQSVPSPVAERARIFAAAEARIHCVELGLGSSQSIRSISPRVTLRRGKGIPIEHGAGSTEGAEAACQGNGISKPATWHIERCRRSLNRRWLASECVCCAAALLISSSFLLSGKKSPSSRYEPRAWPRTNFAGLRSLEQRRSEGEVTSEAHAKDNFVIRPPRNANKGSGLCFRMSTRSHFSSELYIWSYYSNLQLPQKYVENNNMNLNLTFNMLTLV
jgi:hypothetical protein